MPLVEANLILVAFPNARKMRPLSPYELRHRLAGPIDALVGTRPGTRGWRVEHAAIDLVNRPPLDGRVAARPGILPARLAKSEIDRRLNEGMRTSQRRSA